MNSASEAMSFFTFLLISLISDRITTSGNAAADEFSVWQEPEVMEVAPGSNVTMKCHYQGNFAAGWRIWVKWKSNLFINITDPVDVIGILNGSFCLNLPSVRRNQSGTYVCEVIQEIPTLLVKKGNGTVLIVRDSAAVSYTRKDILFIALWTALSMAALTVGTGFLICCKYKRSKPGSSTGENDCQVSDALESEVQNVRLISPRPDSRGHQGQISNVNRAAETTHVLYYSMIQTIR